MILYIEKTQQATNDVWADWQSSTSVSEQNNGKDTEQNSTLQGKAIIKCASVTDQADVIHSNTKLDPAQADVKQDEK